EKNLEKILKLVATEIPAPTIALYIWNEKNEQFVLKSVRVQSDHDAKIGPSYSGLVPYSKETFHPPINLPFDASSLKTERINWGEVPLLNIGISKKAMIRVGPISSITRKQFDSIEHLASILKSPVDILLEAEYYKNQTELLQSSEKAIQYISEVTMDPIKMIQMIVESSFYAFGIKASFFLMKEEQTYQAPFYQGLPVPFIEKIRNDKSVHSFLQHLQRYPSIMLFEKGEEGYAILPEIFKKERNASYLFMRAHINGKVGFLSIRLDDYSNQRPEDRTKIDSIKHMLYKLETYFKLQSQTHQYTQMFTEKLKMLAQVVDNLTPFTVGYSDLMSRYSIILAKELNLPQEQIINIGLAAYLSNIGVIGISDSLVYKEGKYTEVEYEQMKLHSEVGAAIIENTLGNKEIASYIRHHHERMDGNGYPNGLKEEEIPVGARIIGVVQTFLAQINGRAYRAPLTFDRALNVLEAAAGTQLDPKIVGIFINWFSKKRENPLVVGKSLGKCWEMCSVPASICMNCPAYGSYDRNCWEFKENNCAAHGKTCSTCFVYTETMGRKTSSEDNKNGSFQLSQR
ncbi:MAG: HD domain-containing phosphohydrolase, partial [Bacillota bacterium]|nr:HD domain-containing phosphohydrolase [Bacillota bacterium]